MKKLYPASKSQSNPWPSCLATWTSIGRRGRRRYAELWTNISSKPCWHCSFRGKCYRRGGSTGVSTTRQTHLWFRGWLEGWRHELGLEIRSIVIGKDPKYFPEAIVTSISKLIADHRQIKATATHEQRGESMNINTKVEGRNVGLTSCKLRTRCPCLQTLRGIDDRPKQGPSPCNPKIQAEPTIRNSCDGKQLDIPKSQDRGHASIC